MKIGDFGLARDLFNEEFYLKQTKGLVPVKWMPPEAIVDKIYNSKTDVLVLLFKLFNINIFLKSDKLNNTHYLDTKKKLLE